VRLTDLVTHMADKLNEPEPRFHASLMTNVFDLVDLLRGVAERARRGVSLDGADRGKRFVRGN
jgi:hypothetical protein